jgi:hypothetical protein
MQRITQVIQSDAMGQLAIEQTHHMAPRLKAAGLVLGSGRARDLGHLVRRNKIANLAQNAELGTGWGYFELIHPCRVAGANKKLQPFLSYPEGWLCSHFKYI